MNSNLFQEIFISIHPISKEYKGGRWQGGRICSYTADCTFIDAWTTVDYVQLELGLREEAITTFRRILEMSPKMIGLFRREINENQLPGEILE